MSLKLNSSGGGSVTLSEPTTASNLTLNLPAQNGTVVATDASGNVVIGTGSVSGKVRVSAGDGNPILLVNGTSYGVRIGSSVGVGGVIEGVDATGVTSYQPMYLGGSQVLFTTSGAERTRMDSNGNWMINRTTQLAGGSKLSIEQTTANWVAFLKTFNNSGLGITNTSGTAGYTAVGFYNNGESYSACGVITVSGTTTSYGTSSDYRLKENVQPMTGALAKVAALKPVTYTWKSDGSDGEGFIAHELAEVCPHAVVGEKDAVDDDGKIKPQSIDTSFLVATLTAAIQEQQQMIEELKARVASLEGV